MGQRPRTLRPERSGLDLFGAHLRALREHAGLSQSRLGDLVFCSGHLISKIEKADRRPQPDLVRRCDDVLRANGMLLTLAAAIDTADDSPVSPLDAIPALRRLLAAHDAPEDGPVRSLDDLRQDVRQLVEWRLNSAYVDIAGRLPSLLPELQRCMLTSDDPSAARLLVQVYRAADAIADKFGLHDLSAHIIELMRNAAGRCDPVTVAATEYVRAEIFFANGDWTGGLRMLVAAARALPDQSSAARMAVYGALHMRAGVLAARTGDSPVALDHIDEAANASVGVAEGTYRGTAFGPASVRIHQLSIALDSHDVDRAIAVTTGWQPPAVVPAERKSHYYIDLARACIQAGRPDDALDALGHASRVAPEHVQQHNDVKAAIATLLAGTPRPSQHLIGMARWTGILPSVN
jgi:transcriptional regulator with XRE-family HTH domain